MGSLENKRGEATFVLLRLFSACHRFIQSIYVEFRTNDDGCKLSFIRKYTIFNAGKVGINLANNYRNKNLGVQGCFKWI